jgi:solute carrier family 8 (sodium/calcium exchanger)
MSVQGTEDEDGNEQPPKWHHYVMHFLTFFWKVSCAFIPPTSMWGAWPAFVLSLVYIGAMTTCVEQVRHNHEHSIHAFHS